MRREQFSVGYLYANKVDMSILGTGKHELILKNSVADALSVKRGSTDMVVFDTSTPKITITPAVTIVGPVILGSGSVTGMALRINKTANTAGTMLVHCHQLADPGEDYVVNDFKGESLHVANGLIGVGSSWVLDADSTGSLYSIMATAFLGDGHTLSGVGSMTGVSGGVAITAGTVNGADVILSGVIAGMMQSGTGVLTECKYMSALWVSSVLNVAPTAGESQLILLSAEGAAIDQAMFITKIVGMDKFLNLDTAVTAGFVTVGATIAGTPNVKLTCKFGTTTFYLQGYDS